MHPDILPDGTDSPAARTRGAQMLATTGHGVDTGRKRREGAVVGRVRMRVCSTLAVETGDRTLAGRDLGTRKARTLVALLAARRGHLVPLDRIVDALWPDAAPDDPAANVATLVSRTRKVLGEVLVASGRAYGVDTSRCLVDLDEVAGLAAEAERRAAAGEEVLALAALRRAHLVLGPGPALADEPDSDWVQEVRREADDLRRRVRHGLAGVGVRTSPAEAAAVAGEAVVADPYDERAVRDRMRALVAQGSVAAALACYRELAGRLGEELGIAPAGPTERLHLAILREEDLPPEEPDEPRPVRDPLLVGRDAELAALDRLWAQAGTGRGALVLVDGVGGIGKTRVLEAAAELAGSTGGLALAGRCHPAERSLFLQPYVDALRPAILGPGAPDPADLLRDHVGPWVSLLPELAGVLDAESRPRAVASLERRRAYDAVAELLRRLAVHRPLLLAVDDLQYGGAASVDLLGYLAGRLAGEPVLLLGAVRSENTVTLVRLEDRATRLHLDALTSQAVATLAAQAGVADRAATVMERTAGHSLSVVESLRALAAGDTGVPDSLAAAVVARVAQLEDGPREVVQGAAVLSGRLDPRLLARLVDLDEVAAVQHCESLARVGLLHRVGGHYEFVNDLAQECVYRSLAPALAAAYHRRAADLLSARPESMAAHAHAAGEPQRAAQGWLLAGQAAMERSAVEDAVGLLDRALGTGPEPSLRARVLLARARAHEASTAWGAALEDIDEALGLARGSGDRRLQMAALRARGGDVPAALRRPMSDWSDHLDAGLQLATSLADRAAEADFNGRLTVLEASRLQLSRALARAEGSLARARLAAADEALPLALDGLKTVLAYLGDADRLTTVTEELVPLLRAHRSRWLLQWAVFESAFAAAAGDDWDRCRGLVEEALEVNRHTGFTAYAGYFRAHLGWFARLTGDLDAALAHGRTAVTDTSPVDHPWWYAAATGLLAGTLLETGEPGEAAAVALDGLRAAGPQAPESWRLRCLAPLAAAGAATGGGPEDTAYDEAMRLVAGIDCPEGTAWVGGADCYLLVSRAALLREDTGAAANVLAALRPGVTHSWAPVRARVEDLGSQISSASS